jgi:hypothetical protein
LSVDRLTIGNRTLVLPMDKRALTFIAEQTVMAGNIRHPIKSSSVAVVTAHARATTPDGRVRAVLAFTANPGRARGLMYWDAQAFCNQRDAVTAVAPPLGP